MASSTALDPEAARKAVEKIDALNKLQQRMEAASEQLKSCGDVHMQAIKSGDSDLEKKMRARMHELFDENLDCRMDVIVLTMK